MVGAGDGQWRSEGRARPLGGRSCRGGGKGRQTLWKSVGNVIEVGLKECVMWGWMILDAFC